MKRRFKALWLNFLERPDEWFFAGFILTFPLTIRKVIFLFPIEGAYNEYMAGFIYLSDILLGLTIAVAIIKLLQEHKKDDVSSYVSKAGVNDQKLCYRAGDKSWITSVVHNLYWILPAMFVGWSVISVGWAENKTVGLYRSLRHIELFALYGYIVFLIVPRGTIRGLKKLGEIILIFAVIQSFVAIWQFVSQHSIGLKILGECAINANIPGVAKILLGGEKYVRSYGLMPHPNILGGFLVLSIILTIYLYHKLFYEGGRLTAVEHSNGHHFQLSGEEIQKCSTWNILRSILKTTPAYILKKMCLFGKIRLNRAKKWSIFKSDALGIFWRFVSRFSEKIVEAGNFEAGHPMTALCSTCSTQRSSWNNNESFNGHYATCSTGADQKKNWLKNRTSDIFSQWRTLKCSTWNILSRSKRSCTSGQISHDTLHNLPQMWLFDKKCLIKALIGVQIVALIFTFSKSAILSLIFAAAFIALKCSTWNIFTGNRCFTSQVSREENVPRGTIWKTTANWAKRLFHAVRILKIWAGVEHTRIFLLTGGIFLLTFLIFAKPDINSLFFKSMNERFVYLNVSRGTILANIVTGVGAGQFVPTISQYANNLLAAWQYQPVHNVFMLIWAENGLIGLGLFLGWVWVILSNRRDQSGFKMLGRRYLVWFDKRLARDRDLKKCSTWNIINIRPVMENYLKILQAAKLFHIPDKQLSLISNQTQVNQFSVAQRCLEANYSTTIKVKSELPSGLESRQKGKQENDTKLEHKKTNMSIMLALVYLVGGFWAFLFIMLFDHYFWDIWPGQVLLWTVAGFIAGIKQKINKTG